MLQRVVLCLSLVLSKSFWMRVFSCCNLAIIARLQESSPAIRLIISSCGDTGIKSLHQELGGEDAELDDDDDDPLLCRIQRECEKRVKNCEEALKQSQSERHRQAMLLGKAGKDLKDARGEADDAQRGAITMFNEQKRLQSDVHRANTAVDLRMKIQELRDERNDRLLPNSTYCTTVRTILSHLHILYTVRTIHTVHTVHVPMFVRR